MPVVDAHRHLRDPVGTRSTDRTSWTVAVRHPAVHQALRALAPSRLHLDEGRG